MCKSGGRREERGALVSFTLLGIGFPLPLLINWHVAALRDGQDYVIFKIFTHHLNINKRCPI